MREGAKSYGKGYRPDSCRNTLPSGAPEPAELDDPDGDQVWFRIAEEALGRMPDKTPAGRGRCLIDALIVWVTPDRPLHPGLNRFEVRVSEAGDTWLERLRW